MKIREYFVTAPVTPYKHNQNIHKINLEALAAVEFEELGAPASSIMNCVQKLGDTSGIFSWRR
jgi:hypothetical protein